MPGTVKRALAVLLCIGTSAVLPALAAVAGTPHPTPQQAGDTAVKPSNVLGTVQAIDGTTLTVKADSGAVSQVTVPESARLLRIEPGQKTLAGAQPFSLSDLQVGDRVLARGTASEDAKSLTAIQLVAIKAADIAHKQSQEQADWQRRGVSGLVKSVDPATGTITIATGIAGSRTLTVQTAEKTTFRRYAPGSADYDKAQPSTLAEIKPGDQLRARGDKTPDGQGVRAEEVVSGSFQNIAGTVTAVDPSASTITLTDLMTKKPVTVQVSSASQLKKLDPQVAQMLAMRLKAAQGGNGAAGSGGRPGGSGSGAKAGSQGGGPPSGGPGGPGGQSGQGGPGGAGGPGGPGARGGDAQQMLTRAPSISLKDLQKGNMVVLVATGSSEQAQPTVLTLLTGVEPMLQASASGSEALLSSAWNISGGGEGQQQQ